MPTDEELAIGVALLLPVIDTLKLRAFCFRQYEKVVAFRIVRENLESLIEKPYGGLEHTNALQ